MKSNLIQMQIWAALEHNIAGLISMFIRLCLLQLHIDIPSSGFVPLVAESIASEPMKQMFEVKPYNVKFTKTDCHWTTYLRWVFNASFHSRSSAKKKKQVPCIWLSDTDSEKVAADDQNCLLSPSSSPRRWQ